MKMAVGATACNNASRLAQPGRHDFIRARARHASAFMAHGSMRAERKGVAGRWHAQRLRLAKVDNVEYVLLADMRAGDREEEPLRVAAGAVVPVEEQVVLLSLIHI